MYYDGYAKRGIEEAETMINQLKNYRLSLYERAREILAAPWHMELLLRRQRNYAENKISYYLETIKVYDTDGIPPEIIDQKTFGGKERHKAIAEYRSYIKSHPGIICKMQIEKGKWEK